MIQFRVFRTYRLTIGVLIVAMAFFMIGCQGEPSPSPVKMKSPTPQDSVAAGSVQSPGMTSDAEEVSEEAVEEYRYNSLGRRDPFRSIVIKSQGSRDLSDLPPLQQVEITDMKLLGIVWGSQGYFATVKTPDGKGYTIKVGTAVGVHDGVVEKITEGELVVQEELVDIFGTKKKRETILELHPHKERGE